jgi:hypothetical protein
LAQALLSSAPELAATLVEPVGPDSEYADKATLALAFLREKTRTCV